MSKYFFTLIFIGAIILSGCSTPPEKAIQKRWKETGVRGDKDKKERYEGRFNKHVREVEFKEGKIFAYRDGILDASGTYTMAGDGKSLIAKIDGGSDVTINIVSLGGKEMELSVGAVNEDTLVYEVSKK